MTQELIRNGQLDRQAAADALREFLEKIVRAAGFQLKATVNVVAPDAGSDAEVIADLDGRDKELLLEHGAELLKSLEHLAFRALRLEPVHHEKIHLDCGGDRAPLVSEPRLYAPAAAGPRPGSEQAPLFEPMPPPRARPDHMARQAKAPARDD